MADMLAMQKWIGGLPVTKDCGPLNLSRGAEYDRNYLQIRPVAFIGESGSTYTDWVGHTAGTAYGYGESPDDFWLVGSESAFEDAVALAGPGDVIYIANGSYTGTWNVHNCSGTADNPVVIRAQNPGAFLSRNATFTGNGALRFTGTSSHIVVAGLNFSFTTTKNPAAVQFEGASGSGPNNIRITDCDFIFAGTSTSNHYGIGISKSVSYITVDHTYWDCGTRQGYFITISPATDEVSPTTDDYRYASYDVTYGTCNNIAVRYNTFKNIKHQGALCYFIQYGQYPDHYKFDQNNTIEYNYFTNASATPFLEVKTGANTIQYNFFDTNSGTAGVTLRAGDGQIFRGNYMYDCKHGVAVSGNSNSIVNNVFDLVWGDYAIALVRGREEGDWTAAPPLTYRNHFPQVTGNLIANNTILSNVYVATGIHVNYGGSSCTTNPDDGCGDDPPINCKIYNNSVGVGKSGAIAIYQAPETGTGTYSTPNVFSNNLVHLSGGAVSGAASGEGWTDANLVTNTPVFVGSSPQARPDVSSPTVNAGTSYNVNGINSGTYVDFDGNARTVGTVDIGAIEYGATAASIARFWHVLKKRKI